MLSTMLSSGCPTVYTSAYPIVYIAQCTVLFMLVSTSFCKPATAKHATVTANEEWRNKQ